MGRLSPQFHPGPLGMWARQKASVEEVISRTQKGKQGRDTSQGHQRRAGIWGRA